MHSTAEGSARRRRADGGPRRRGREVTCARVPFRFQAAARNVFSRKTRAIIQNDNTVNPPPAH